MFDDAAFQQVLTSAIAEMQELFTRWSALGELSLTEFRDAVFDVMRSIYDAAAATVPGGELSLQEREAVEDAINNQLFPGQDQDGESYSLTERFQAFEDAAITAAQLNASLVMYLRSARSTAYEVWRGRQGKGRQGYRTLGATDQHCEECLLYASLSPIALEDVVIPGRQCSCYTNCLCSILVVGEDG